MPLYIVSTPIGNMEDITFRAIRVLKEADIILAEDTRRTRILLSHYDITYRQLVSYHEHNKVGKTPFIIEYLKEGKNIAIVSDSGTPGISDPGFYLVRECVRNDLQVIPVPGPSAVISALVSSGLETDRFAFYGFLPKKESKKIEYIRLLQETDSTVIFYESPYRIKKTIALFDKFIPEHRIVIARELTKKFEELIRGTVSEVNALIKDRELKGEMVLVLGRPIKDKI